MKATGPSQRNFRKEIGTHDTDIGVARHERLFGFDDIRSALQQRRREPSRHLGNQRLICERSATRNRTGIVALQHANQVLLLLRLALQIDNCRRGAKYQLFGLAHIELRRGAARSTDLRQAQ
jgi:hypothetical protein